MQIRSLNIERNCHNHTGQGRIGKLTNFPEYYRDKRTLIQAGFLMIFTFPFKASAVLLADLNSYNKKMIVDAIDL